MKYYRLPMDKRDFLFMPEVVQTDEKECFALVLNGAAIHAEAVEISQAEFDQVKVEMGIEATEKAPGKSENQQILEKLATLEAKVDAISVAQELAKPI